MNSLQTTSFSCKFNTNQTISTIAQNEKHNKKKFITISSYWIRLYLINRKILSTHSNNNRYLSLCNSFSFFFNAVCYYCLSDLDFLVIFLGYLLLAAFVEVTYFLDEVVELLLLLIELRSFIIFLLNCKYFFFGFQIL